MDKIKVKVEVEKEIAVPKLTKLDNESDKLCVLDDNIVNMNCGGILCEDCICNIDNLMMLTNSQKIQLL